MSEFWSDMLIGLISGVVSSTLVTLVFMWRDSKRTKKIGFQNDVQTFHRWILRVRNELEISYRLNDVSSLLRAIEEEPILTYFNNLSEESLVNKRQTTEFIRNLSNYRNQKVDETKFKQDVGFLFKYSVEALKYTQSR